MPLNSDTGISVPADIFKTYDIRGVAGESLTHSNIRLIGQAFGSEYADEIEGDVLVACDARLSSPELKSALIDGVRSVGLDVIDLGTIPTPLLYFAAHNSASGTGLMVTASHNPPRFNGIKLTLANKPFYGDAIKRLYQRISKNDLPTGSLGRLSEQSVVDIYRQAVSSDIQISAPVRVVLDCANGVAGGIAPKVLRDIGCEVIELYCEVDGRFPNHSADPTRPENLQDLIAAVIAEKADVGLAIDGDGDRLVAVSPLGEIVWPDRLMILFARDILSVNLGRQVVFDVKCQRSLAREIDQAGGKPILWKTGHSLIRAKMLECDAIFGGEMSGHLYFNDRWPGFDDGIYASARLCEMLGRSELSATEIFRTLPDSVNTPEIRIHCHDPHTMIERFRSHAKFEDAEIITIDGLRADFNDGFGLIRASNTAPEIVLRFDADSEAGLARIREKFYYVLGTLIDMDEE